MNAPSPVSPGQFRSFFEALWGYEPFPWQAEFPERLCAGAEPEYITVPTGSGKTACLDASLFALAVQASHPASDRTIGRRIFFVVNRRVIVDEAYERAKCIAAKLGDALQTKTSTPTDIVWQVAWWLRKLAGGEKMEPLSCVELRGGIYRDRAWAKSILQPTIVCGTVDQVGSRILFRGYGVSPEARPIHAALVAQDSLLLVDEAHISLPFIETLRWVQRYRTFAPPGSETVKLPFSLICLTATPPKSSGEHPPSLGLSEADRTHPVLQPRLTCAKPARLVVEPSAKGKQWNTKLAERLIKEAVNIVSDSNLTSLVIFTNRVATARAVYERAKEKFPKAKVTLLLGRMRPLDRDLVTAELQADLKTARPGGGKRAERPFRIVVSTQCLEVGADLDFDALVTECASLDALRQRFGRLNRGGRQIEPRATIVLPEEQNADPKKLSEDKPLDSIYGNATPLTWAWLHTISEASIVDFGLTFMNNAVENLRASNEEAFSSMLTPVRQAPVLLPAYLDCWVQTNPTPAADPDVAMFLHGPQRDMAEIQVCWRADLPDNSDEQSWAETLSLCPPTTLECLPVPFALFQQRMRSEQGFVDTSGDAPERLSDEDKASEKPMMRALLWRGSDSSHFVSDCRSLRPGDTLVIRAQDGGWEELGYLPSNSSDSQTKTAAQVDRGEDGQAQMRRRVFLRLHPALRHPEEGTPMGALMEWAGKYAESEVTDAELKQMLREAAESFEPESIMFQRLQHLAATKRPGVELYPDGSGVVITTPVLLKHDTTALAAVSDESADDPLLEASEQQSLDVHTLQVIELAVAFSKSLGLPQFSEAIRKAATLHDAGKADRRFQALLVGGDVAMALAQPTMLAKSTAIPVSHLARERARKRATLPSGFRHEMISVQLAGSEAGNSMLPSDGFRRMLTLHLIASHHGYARPFAPVVNDDSPPSVEVTLDGVRLAITGGDRTKSPAYALDSGVAERFWHLTRHHGWWGLALLETLLRLADQTASASIHPNE